MEGQECGPDLEALVQEEIDQAVSQAEAGLLPVAEVGSEAEGGRYREMVRQVGGTTYIVRIFEGDENAEGLQQYTEEQISEAVSATETAMFGQLTAESGSNMPDPEVVSLETEQPAEPALPAEPAEPTEPEEAESYDEEEEPLPESTDNGTVTIYPLIEPQSTPVPKMESQSTPVRSRRTIKKPARLLDGDEELETKPVEKVVKLPRVTRSNLDVDDLFIEVEIERDLFVSHLEREEIGKNMYKYRLRVSSGSFAGAFPHEPRIEKVPRDAPKTKSKTPSKKAAAQSTEEATVEPDKSKRGRPKKSKVEVPPAQKSTKATPKVKQPVKSEPKDEQADKSVEADVQELAEVNETETPNLEGTETADGDTQTEVDTQTEGDSQTVKDEGEMTEMDMEGFEEMSDDFIGSNLSKRVLGEDGVEKKKRKYTKRNAYSQDESNYTVRKNEQGNPVYKCNMCGIEMRWPGNMRDHLRTHSKECPFICTFCGKGFTNQANFNHHVPIHSDERPYICDICGFSFKIKRALTTHYRRHISSGNHVCQICGKRFHSSTEVNKHTVLHTGERNYECKTCGKKFKQGSALYRHKFTHTSDGKHQCLACGVCFGRKDYYRTHLLKNHGDLIGKEEWVNEILNATHLTPAMMKKEKKEVVQQLEHHAPQVIQYEIVDSDGHRYEAQIENLDVPIANSEIEIATNKITFVLADGTIQ